MNTEQDIMRTYIKKLVARGVSDWIVEYTDDDEPNPDYIRPADISYLFGFRKGDAVLEEVHLTLTKTDPIIRVEVSMGGGCIRGDWFACSPERHSMNLDVARQVYRFYALPLSKSSYEMVVQSKDDFEN